MAIETLRAKIERSVRRRALKTLFPKAGPELLEKAQAYQYAILGDNAGYSLGMYNPATKTLFTDEKVAFGLPAEKLRQFSTVFAIQSHSNRAMYIVEKDGKVSEFKGKAPFQFYPGKRNLNSGDPEGLLSLAAARNEVKGLSLIGELEAEAVDLGALFPAYDGYAQLYRSGKEGKYYPWLRLDSRPGVTRTLAELEGKTLAQFLHESGERLGRQLRKLHKAGYTLHNPWREGTVGRETVRKPLWYSSLHSANVEIHGNLIDPEGMRTFAEAEQTFWRRLAAEPTAISAKERSCFEAGKVSVHYYSRLCDIQRFFGGTHRLEKSIAGVLGKDSFIALLKGFLAGYYDGYQAKEKIDQVILGFNPPPTIKRIDLSRTNHILRQLEAA
ncbi:MAG: hypothetical protein WCW67_01080 [Candidatus Margulisiibacteriota bacterium]